MSTVPESTVLHKKHNKYLPCRIDLTSQIGDLLNNHMGNSTVIAIPSEGKSQRHPLYHLNKNWA